jgi:hypothetical protein
MDILENLFCNTSNYYRMKNDILRLKEENSKLIEENNMLSTMCSTPVNIENESELPSPALSRLSSLSSLPSPALSRQSSSSSYKQKYIKYKQKYLKLRNSNE